MKNQKWALVPCTSSILIKRIVLFSFPSIQAKKLQVKLPQKLFDVYEILDSKFPVRSQRPARGGRQGGDRGPCEKFEARRAAEDFKAAPGSRLVGGLPVQREQRRESAKRKRFEHAGTCACRKQSQFDILRRQGRHQPNVRWTRAVQSQGTGRLHAQPLRQGSVKV